MSDLRKSIESENKRPYEWVPETSQIERDKKGKEIPPPEEPSKEREGGVLALLSNWAKQMLATFSAKEEEKSPEYQIIADHLRELKRLFLILSAQEVENHPDFIQSLSSIWQELLADDTALSLQTSTRKKLFKQCIEQIALYPKGSTHTFGYYLTEHVGDEWLPFPFFDLLKQLHEDHQRSPLTSTLSEWIYSLECTIETLETI